MSVGSLIGPYRILDTLGQGGMGVVYRARHARSDQVVALKTVQVPSWWLLESIRREIHALTMIRHPGVVRIQAHGIHDGRPWYAMDLLEGETLRNYLQRIWSPFRANSSSPGSTEQLSVTEAVSANLGTDLAQRPGVVLPPVEHAASAAAGELQTVLRIIRNLCATLAYMHGEGVINCDLKPENVLIVKGEPILIDFGLIARNLPRETLESARVVAGTLPYMSPEQIRGEFVDARSDLYSLGCILYEALGGSPPFFGTTPAIRTQHLSDTPRPLSELVSDVPSELEECTRRLLEKHVVDRFGFADEVASLVGRLIEGDARLGHFPTPRAYLYRPAFVGRDDIIASLVSARGRAAAGSGGIALLAGESGVGKTRLAMEVTRLLPGSPMRVLTSEVSPLAIDQATGVAPAPLHALQPLLRAVAARCQEGGPAITERLLGAARNILVEYEPLLAGIPCAHDDNAPIPLSPEASRRRLFRCLASTLHAFAQELPILLVIDDLGWEDELSIAFLQSLSAEYFRDSRVFILCTHRSEEASDQLDAFDKNHVERYRVQRLSTDAVRSIVSDMLAVHAPSEEFVQFVSGEAEGNPFFVAEYLRAAVGERLLYRDEQHTWCFADERIHHFDRARLLSLPSSLKALIERRLNNLSTAAREIGVAAAVLGRDVETALLYEVVGLGESACIGALDELLRREVLEQPEPDRIRFAHDKLREVSYSLAKPEQRVALHARAAHALEARSRDAAEMKFVWTQLGHHYAAAHVHESAAHYLRLAADHARGTYANEEANRLYREAIAQLNLASAHGEEPGARAGALLRLHEGLAAVLALTGQRDKARDLYLEAIARAPDPPSATRARLYRQLGKTWEVEHQYERALGLYASAQAAAGDDPNQATAECRDEWIQVQIEQLWVYYWLARVQDMESIVQRLSPVVEAYGSSLQRARYFQTRTLANMRRDRYAISAETLGHALASLDASHDPAASGQSPMAQFLYGFALLLAGALDEAEVELNKAEALARRTGDAGMRARSLTYLTVVARRRGNTSATKALADESTRTATAAGAREYVAGALANQAWVALREHHTQEAAALATESLAIWASLKLVSPFKHLALTPLIRLEIVWGDVAAAVAHAEQMLAADQQILPRDVSEALAEAQEGWARGDVAATTGALERALEELDSA